jgi:hypothetical protein
MRWTATAEMANELRTNAAVRYQKARAPTATLGAICGSSVVLVGRPVRTASS